MTSTNCCYVNKTGKGYMESYALDPCDLEILKIIQKNARLSPKEIGYAVRKSKNTVTRRIERMVESGYIVGAETLLNQQRICNNLIIFTTVQLTDHTAGQLANFQKTMCSLSQVHECYHLTGASDFMLKIVVADMAAYQRFLAEELANLPGIGVVRSHMVIHEAKRNFGYPIKI